MALLQKLLPKTSREAAFLALGMGLILGGYAAYQKLESTYPGKLKPVLQRLFGKNEVPCNGRPVPTVLDLERAGLTLDDIVAQSVFTTYSGDYPLSTGFMYLTPADTSRLEGGEIVFIPEEARRRVCSSKVAGVIPPFVGDEGEGGYATRIELRLPPAELLGLYFEGKDTPELQRYPSLLTSDQKIPDQKTREENIQKLFQSAALTLKNMHIDYVFSPVLDTVRDVHHLENLMSANDRAYSSDPQTVIRLARMYINAMHAQGIKVVAKHFLGTGYTRIDPHQGLPSLEGVTQSELEHAFQPFAALKDDLDGIMVTHVVNPETKLPLSVSPQTYRNLREKLGFKGIIITDDMYMGAIEDSYSDAEDWIVSASLDALLADADGVIVKHPDQAEAIKTAISSRVSHDQAFRKRMMESFERLLKFKGIHVENPAGVDAVVAGKKTPEGVRWIARRVKSGETFIHILAQEDGSLVAHNRNGDPYVVDNAGYQKMLNRFVHLNGIAPRQLRAGTVYYFPDLNGDGTIPATIDRKEIPSTGRTEQRYAVLEASLPRGHNFSWYLAGELGMEVVDQERGYLLPVTRGPLSEHYDLFRKDNPQVANFRRMPAGERYHFRDVNGNGRVDFKDPVSLVRQYQRRKR